MYADDLMLLSSSVSGLQKLLDVSVMTAKELCLQFNDRKSHCIVLDLDINVKMHHCICMINHCSR